MKKVDSSATWCDGYQHADGLGRRAIGTEVNKSYCQIIVRQLSQRVLWPANDGTQRPGSPDVSLATETRSRVR